MAMRSEEPPERLDDAEARAVPGGDEARDEADHERDRDPLREHRARHLELPEGAEELAVARLPRARERAEEAPRGARAHEPTDERHGSRLGEQRQEDRPAPEAEALQDRDLRDALADAHRARVGRDQHD